MEKFNYNDAYTFVTPEWLNFNNFPLIEKYILENNESLINFINDYIEKFPVTKGQFLECGSGIGGLCLSYAEIFTKCTGVDISSLAISGAKELAKLKNKDIHYLNFDLTQNINLDQKFDLIVDSHLLHCLTENEERKNYYRFLKEHLNSQGHILIETMCFQKNMTFPNEYFFDESNILFRKDRAFRKILLPIELETEILEEGFEINYLYYHDELSFSIFKEDPDYPHDELPKTLRLALKYK